ncbi:hypothetical protein [Psychroflexus sediminis]|uniref:Uncharacterized protein n=1 Tax=Psychroflexus sediminis TaxID=470826 RepID=A0A1G7X4K8_9FLAO|nr:hypothetical protein [Psychroflexus sediminis]SDG79057.1 hypothetical protein SAMN04488027_10782 [Psychroflexus sediminis]
MKFSKELKEAISHLPDKEKDKLLIRLLKKDLILAKRLEFELVSAQSVDEKRTEMEEQIKERVKEFSEGFYSLGYLNMDIRFLSGDITEYVKVTKDKFGEVSLNVLLLTEVLNRNNYRIQSFSMQKGRKLLVAIIARAFKIILLAHKLHKDYHIELEDPMRKLGRLIGQNHYLMKTAIFNGFDVNWMITGDIPEDIESHYKDLRKQGYLR